MSPPPPPPHALLRIEPGGLELYGDIKVRKQKNCFDSLFNNTPRNLHQERQSTSFINILFL
jgi:hypothetical protein